MIAAVDCGSAWSLLSGSDAIASKPRGFCGASVAGCSLPDDRDSVEGKWAMDYCRVAGGGCCFALGFGAAIWAFAGAYCGECSSNLRRLAVAALGSGFWGC